MKAIGLFVVYWFTGSVFVPAASHVRPLDPYSVATYEAGARQSATFRALADALQRSDLIVHVVTTRDLPALVAGTTRFVADRGSTRYVRVDLAASLSPKARVAVLAHELQHACEIAGSSARSSIGVETFYRVRGRRAPTLTSGWETREAVAVERRVWLELGSHVSAGLVAE